MRDWALAKSLWTSEGLSTSLLRCGAANVAAQAHAACSVGLLVLAGVEYPDAAGTTSETLSGLEVAPSWLFRIRGSNFIGDSFPSVPVGSD